MRVVFFLFPARLHFGFLCSFCAGVRGDIALISFFMFLTGGFLSFLLSSIHTPSLLFFNLAGDLRFVFFFPFRRRALRLEKNRSRASLAPSLFFFHPSSASLIVLIFFTGFGLHRARERGMEKKTITRRCMMRRKMKASKEPDFSLRLLCNLAHQ